MVNFNTIQSRKTFIHNNEDGLYRLTDDQGREIVIYVIKGKSLATETPRGEYNEIKRYDSNGNLTNEFKRTE